MRGYTAGATLCFFPMCYGYSKWVENCCVCLDLRLIQSSTPFESFSLVDLLLVARTAQESQLFPLFGASKNMAPPFGEYCKAEASGEVGDVKTNWKVTGSWNQVISSNDSIIIRSFTRAIPKLSTTFRFWHFFRDHCINCKNYGYPYYNNLLLLLGTKSYHYTTKNITLKSTSNYWLEFFLFRQHSKLTNNNKK